MPDLGLAGGALPQGNTLDTSVGATGTGPAAPPGPGSTYNTPIPGVAQYSQIIALAQNAYKQAVANINLQRGNLLQQYGYTGTIDPATGLIKNLGVDAHNPYGAYQQTLKSAGQQMGQERQSMAERGIHGGLDRQAQTGLQYGFGQATTALTNNLQNSLLGLQSQQNQAKFGEQNQIVQAQLAALQQAISMMLSGQTIDPALLGGISLPQPV